MLKLNVISGSDGEVEPFHNTPFYPSIITRIIIIFIKFKGIWKKNRKLFSVISGKRVHLDGLKMLGSRHFRLFEITLKH